MPGEEEDRADFDATEAKINVLDSALVQSVVSSIENEVRATARRLSAVVMPSLAKLGQEAGPVLLKVAMEVLAHELEALAEKHGIHLGAP